MTDAVWRTAKPIFFTGYVITRWKGGVFFFHYVAYVAHFVFAATDRGVARILHEVMFVFVIPPTAITLMVTTSRTYHQQLSPTGALTARGRRDA